MEKALLGNDFGEKGLEDKDRKRKYLLGKRPRGKTGAAKTEVENT